METSQQSTVSSDPTGQYTDRIQNIILNPIFDAWKYEIVDHEIIFWVFFSVALRAELSYLCSCNPGDALRGIKDFMNVEESFVSCKNNT